MEAKDKAHQLVEVLNEKCNQLLIKCNARVEELNELIATNKRNEKIKEEKERRRNRSRHRS